MSVFNILFKTQDIFSKILFYAKEKGTGLFDTLCLKFGIPDQTLNLEKAKDGRKRILVVGKGLNFRVIKHMRWLKKTDRFEIIFLLHQTENAGQLETDSHHRLFHYRNSVHLRRMLLNSENISLVYAFASSPSYAMEAIKSSKYPTLFDAYDCLVVYYGENPPLTWMKREIEAENYCFENADFILARNLESRQSPILFKLKTTNQKRILFGDYCDNLFFVSQKPKSIKETIDIVYSGGIYGKNMQRSSHYFNDFFAFINDLKGQNIRFHIYPINGVKKETLLDFEQEEKRNTNIQLHSSIPQNKLTQELSLYHFGVLPHFKEKGAPVLNDKLKYGTSLKFFNFLEAGLPILVSAEMEYMAWMVKRYHIGIVFSKEETSNLQEIIPTYDYATLQKNVLAVREKLSFQNNFERLLLFIDKACESK